MMRSRFWARAIPLVGRRRRGRGGAGGGGGLVLGRRAPPLLRGGGGGAPAGRGGGAPGPARAGGRGPPPQPSHADPQRGDLLLGAHEGAESGLGAARLPLGVE